MRLLLKAVGVFLGGSFAVLALMLGFKLLAVGWLGDRIYRLPHLQMERLAQLLPRKPVSAANLLVMGDSTATLSIDARNFQDAEAFASVNATSIETFYTLKKILESGARPRCLIASFSFQWDLNREFFWPMFVAGKFYSAEDLKEIAETRRKHGESGSALLERAKKFAAERGWYDINDFVRIQEALYRLKWSKAQTFFSRSSLWSHKGSKALPDGTNFEGSLEMFFSKDPAFNATEKDYFNRFLVLARDHKIPVFIVKIPFAQSVPLENKLRYWQKYEEILLTAEAPFRLVSPPSMPEEFYISAGHLNVKGINAMSTHLVKAVESCFL